MSTPVRRQYLTLKAQFPNAILFFRLGDFYEMFDEDALVGSRELELHLTSREFTKGERAPMCGVPYHAAETHIARLVSRGYKVAVCEQLGDPQGAKGKGLVEREVVRVVTPGTAVEGGLLDPRRNRYLAAALIKGDDAGVAYVDSTTGEISTVALHGKPVATLVERELSRVAPTEILWPSTDVERPPRAGHAPEDVDELDEAPVATRDKPVAPVMIPDAFVTPYEPRHFTYQAASRLIMKHYDLRALDGQPYARLPLAIGAVGALLAYLEQTQRALLPQLRPIAVHAPEDHMALDGPTRRNLEIDRTMRGGAAEGSLLWVLDRTKTAMGARLLRRWVTSPLLRLAPLRARQDAVARLVDDTALRLKLTVALGQLPDLERLTGKVLQSTATPRDLIALKTALERAAALRDVVGELDPPPPAPSGGAWGDASPQTPAKRRVEIDGHGPQGHSSDFGQGPRRHSSDPAPEVSGGPVSLGSTPDMQGEDAVMGPTLGSLVAALDGRADVCDLIARAIVDDPKPRIGDGVFIRDGYSEELDSIEEQVKEARQWMAGLEKTEKERTGIRSLKVTYNKVFGYSIEISHANRELVPPDYTRKQTLVNAERYITPELKEKEGLILSADERRAAIEAALLAGLRERISAQAPRLLRTAAAIAGLDVYAGLATVAVERDYTRPELDDGARIEIVEGRHPVVEVAQRETPFVPNGITLDAAEEQIAILTGPNMSGKSCFLRQTALIVLLAQIGSFVPAARARIGMVDRVFTRVGAQDDIATGHSTFMVEMVETATILNSCTARSLLILDEIGRGTSTYDGVAIAQAIVEHLHETPRRAARTIFATHYHELNTLAEAFSRVRNYRMDVLEEGGEVCFLRKVVPGGADKSYGIHVAELAGIPKEVVRRARQILRELEKRARAERDALDSLQLSFFAEPLEPRGAERDGQVKEANSNGQVKEVNGNGYHPGAEGFGAELAALDIDGMTPLEALTTLAGLHVRARST